MKKLASNLSKVRGLGSTNDGVHAWWMQRLSGIALVPLIVWFIFSILELPSSNYSGFIFWVSSGVNPVLLCLLIIFMFHHGLLGIQVIFEDYIKSDKLRLGLLVFSKLIVIMFGAYSFFAIINLTFGR